MIAVIPCIPPLSIDCFFNAFRHVLGLHLSLIPLLVLLFQIFQVTDLRLCAGSHPPTTLSFFSNGFGKVFVVEPNDV